MNRYRRKFAKQFEQQGLDVLLSPAFALPAMCHDDGIDLLPAGSHAMLQNLVGGPGGMVPWSTVLEGEETDRQANRDGAIRRAIKTETDSVGLPVGVQVSSLPWQEHRVLAVMRELQHDIRSRQRSG